MLFVDTKRFHFKKEQLYRMIIVIGIILTIIAAVYAIITGRHYFTRRNLLQLQTAISSYGVWSPLIIFFLIFINILVPPLPLPIPLVEIATGVIYGLWPGIILIWITQVISAVTSFVISKYIGKLFLKKLIQSKFLSFFKRFIEKKGALAIFVIRATMSSPFNISYLAGFMQIGFIGFMIATALGIIPETVLFVYLGTLIQHTRIRLWYVFIGLVVVGILPFTVLLVSKLFPKKEHQS